MRILTAFTISLLSLLIGACSQVEHSYLKVNAKAQEGSFGGGFQYRLDRDRLSVYRNNKEKPLISFDLNKAFLSAARAKANVGYHMAAFSFDEEVQSICNRQSIDTIEANQANLKIKGNLTNGPDASCNIRYVLTFSKGAEKSLKYQVNLENEKGANRIYLRYSTSKNEAFYGFGEQFSHVNMKGHKFLLWSEEQGIGRGAEPITTGADLTAGAGGNAYTTYAPIPFYLTTENRAMFLENSSYMSFDLTQNKAVKLEVWNDSLTGLIWQDESPLNLLERYTAHTGRFPKLPKWAFGTILGLQGGKERVSRILNETLDYNHPVKAIWIQDWEGQRKTSFGSQLWWRWTVDEKAYPNLKEWTGQLRDKEVRTLGYINSFLANEGDMFEEAKEKDYLVKNPQGEDYKVETAGFPAYLVDLTNPEARAWLKDIIKNNMLSLGFDGWMADFGEWLPTDAQLHSGISAKEYHNRYPVEWAKLNREAIEEAGRLGDVFFFTRAGYSYSNKHSTMFWEGDQMVTFDQHDGLASAITGLITSGMSGITINHSDIGGYTTINNPLKNYHRSQELFMRWAEANAFSPIFRTHEGNRPEENHQFYTAEKTQEHFAKMGRIHWALRDYLQKLNQQATNLGYPMVRSLYLHYPDDRHVRNLRHQYLLGRDILVLPVVKAKSEYVEGYFPEGKWEHIFTGKMYEGETYHRIHAPIGRPAAFLLKGGENYDELKSALSQVITPKNGPKNKKSH